MENLLRIIHRVDLDRKENITKLDNLFIGKINPRDIYDNLNNYVNELIFDDYVLLDYYFDGIKSKKMNEKNKLIIRVAPRYDKIDYSFFEEVKKEDLKEGYKIEEIKGLNTELPHYLSKRKIDEFILYKKPFKK